LLAASSSALAAFSDEVGEVAHALAQAAASAAEVAQGHRPLLQSLRQDLLELSGAYPDVKFLRHH
jgi:hypothetical protein